MDRIHQAAQDVYVAALRRAYSEVADGGRETTGASADLDFAHDQWDRALRNYASAVNTRDVGGTLEARIAFAVADPGSFVGDRRGPTWPSGHPAYDLRQETVSEWSARAVIALLTQPGECGCPGGYDLTPPPYRAVVVHTAECRADRADGSDAKL